MLGDLEAVIAKKVGASSVPRFSEGITDSPKVRSNREIVFIHGYTGGPTDFAELPSGDLLFINDEEAQKFTGETNNVIAARRLAQCGPKTVVLKKGEHGALLLAEGRVYPFPAYPVEFNGYV